MTHKPLYITTTIPYVNAPPHIGFAAEIVAADIFARHARLLGREVFFNTGTDEHGQKIYEAAKKAGKSPQAYADEYAEKFKSLKGALGLSDNINFIRTTDPHHVAAAEEFWRRCDRAGYIYKKNYKVKYCVGCELEKTDSELVDGRCPIHPNQEIELIEEENYFFKFSAFQEKLLKLYDERPDFVIPDFRFNEIKVFVSRGLKDFSISRLKSKMPWGVPVPDDPAHVQYVWFDAFINYISAIGWPSDGAKFQKWWIESGGVVQFAGKDQVRQQAAMWQAMLMAADLPPSRQIVIRGFINSGGQKMSKSSGNVISPFDLVAGYGTDAVRYFLARHVNPFEDSDVTPERIKEVYNADLVNGLGNLVSRVMKMVVSYDISYEIDRVEAMKETIPDPLVSIHLESFHSQNALKLIWERIGHNDALIALKQPFLGIKSEDKKIREEALNIIQKLVRELHAIAVELAPLMPTTSDTILKLIAEHRMPASPLFPRKV